MTGTRLPAHVEVSAIIKQVQVLGGFAAVLSRGDRDAGTIVLLSVDRGSNASLWERMPSLDGPRLFTVTREQDAEKPTEFSEYVSRRAAQDNDLWIVEIDLPNAAEFIESRVNRVDS
ncbi:DUF1491 family protein [Altererythrobacter sp. HHU K3-1]|uniref:DUF1491 family protein n=1 Tax=Qipengyuania atrilutea TaxID=2744473 RepID=A0A850H1R5_9SPHN|nr:DUF1491 family protein [Actirhodobacter atriluteus]